MKIKSNIIIMLVIVNVCMSGSASKTCSCCAANVVVIQILRHTNLTKKCCFVGRTHKKSALQLHKCQGQLFT